MSVFVIAEAGSTWEGDLEKAYRLIRAAKDCGADACKFQWTSSPERMAARRGLPDAAPMYRKYLAWPQGYIPELKAKCDEVGIQFGCTVFLRDDIGAVAPFVDFFKISAFESEWGEFVADHIPYKKRIIASVNPGGAVYNIYHVGWLHCISEYPTPIENLKLNFVGEYWIKGLSDHTTSLLTGAVAVGRGARCIEKHIRLMDTSKDCPDYPHSLIASTQDESRYFVEQYAFAEYVRNIRDAEVMM